MAGLVTDEIAEVWCDVTAQHEAAQNEAAETLHGKVAVVTGAGQGIGLGIARALGGTGVSVAVLGVPRPSSSRRVNNFDTWG